MLTLDSLTFLAGWPSNFPSRRKIPFSRTRKLLSLSPRTEQQQPLFLLGVLGAEERATAFASNLIKGKCMRGRREATSTSTTAIFTINIVGKEEEREVAT